VGFFSKVTGSDARYAKYRKAAESALVLVEEQAKSIRLDFKEIMDSENGWPHLRLTSFIVGYVGVLVENTPFMKIRGYKSMEICKAVMDLLGSKGYKEYDFNYLTREKLVELVEDEKFSIMETILSECSFYHGGMHVATRMRMNDDINTIYNLSIFLRTLKKEDGSYMDGSSNYEMQEDK
jgi:hypothetical protein